MAASVSGVALIALANVWRADASGRDVLRGDLLEVGAVLAWGETNLSAPRTVCMIDPPNVASLRVAAKCGYREWTRAKYKGHEVMLFER